MAIDLLRRRAQLQAKLDEYEGCKFGVTVVRAYGEFAPCLLPLLELPSNCVSLTIGHYVPMASVSACICYKDGSAANNYTTSTTNTISKNLTAGAFDSIRCLVNLDRIDDCYVKDNTNNQYLWKGKNVT